MGRIGTPLGLAIGAPIRGTWVPKIDTSVLGGIGNNGNNGYYNGGLEDDPGEITLGNDGTARHGYFLFTGVGVPQGSTIISAYINLTASNDANETVVNLRIVGSDEDNPSKPTNAADAAGRPRTDAERRKRHKKRFGTSKLPPRGTGLKDKLARRRRG